MITPKVSSEQADEQTVDPNPPSIPRLAFIDSLRALMALWVMLGHGFQDFIHLANSHARRTDILSQAFFQQAFYAHFAVDIFIVISGFCLMLPTLRQPGFRLPGGPYGFALRRARRILPPYYCALLLAICCSALRWYFCRPSGEATWILKLDLSWSSIAAHLFLIQNLNDWWARGLDGPTWSIATESQIYVLFAMLLLPLWRLLGGVPVIIVAFLAGLTLYWTSPSGLSSCSWYLGLFAMGMGAAQLSQSSISASALRVTWAAGIALLVLVFVLVHYYHWMPDLMWALDGVIGAAAACLIAVWASQVGKSSNPSLLNWPPLVFLGSFSYSLYLIHSILLNVMVTILLQLNADPWLSGGLILCAFPAVVVIAYQFYFRYEAPFIGAGKSRQESQ